ncbi:MAG: hypothetical protein ACRDVM_06445 [Acidimicrobiia bacterium]
MARHLVVAYQTAESPELRRALRDLHTHDPAGTFVLLVPATPVEHLSGWTEGESRAVAGEAGERARHLLAAEGIPVEDVVIGDPNPLYAVEDELNRQPYDQVVVSTLPPGASRWLKMDVVSRLQRSLEIPVTHVQAGG